jgi:hypothetical protein
MKQRYDLFAVSFLMFAAVFVVWLTVDPKGFALKDWQPLMASFVALGAATLAYNAAMAKVNYDRARELRELSRKRLGIYLRLRYAAAELVRQTNNVKLALGMNVTRGKRNVPVYSITIGNPKELEEAWANLDLFPVAVSMLIDYVRENFNQARKIIDAVPNVNSIEVSTIGVTSGTPFYEYLTRCERINEQCVSIGTLRG